MGNTNSGMLHLPVISTYRNTCSVLFLVRVQVWISVRSLIHTVPDASLVSALYRLKDGYQYWVLSAILNGYWLVWVLVPDPIWELVLAQYRYLYNYCLGIEEDRYPYHPQYGSTSPGLHVPLLFCMGSLSVHVQVGVYLFHYYMCTSTVQVPVPTCDQYSMGLGMGTLLGTITGPQQILVIGMVYGYPPRYHHRTTTDTGDGNGVLH